MRDFPLVRRAPAIVGQVGTGGAQRRMPSAWRRSARVCWLPQRTKHARIPVSRALVVGEAEVVQGMPPVSLIAWQRRRACAARGA